MKRLVKSPVARISATALVPAAALVSPGLATPPSGVTVSPIINGHFGPLQINSEKVVDNWNLKIKSKSNTDVRVVRVTLAPGGQLGWHSHPGEALITMVEGTLTDYDGSDAACPGHTIHAGDTFVEPEGNVHNVRNLSGASATFVAVGFFPAGAPTTVSEPKPTNCAS